ncbi:hypothetical protein [uncultured Bacteroides sp.]|nr:hypothetical protein [uncultured Bacteroides sp.]
MLRIEAPFRSDRASVSPGQSLCSFNEKIRLSPAGNFHAVEYRCRFLRQNGGCRTGCDRIFPEARGGMDMHPCCRSVYRRAIFPEPRGATDAASQADRRFPMAPRVQANVFLLRFAK